MVGSDDGIALLPYGGRQGFACGLALNADLIPGTVNLDDGLRVNGMERPLNRFFAVATGHFSHLELVFHHKTFL